MNLSIIIVTHNSGRHLSACLDSCRRVGLFESADVLVVDNASDDDTVAEARRFDGVDVIANQTNRGFAGAVNQGFAATDGEFVLLLNPDTQLLTPVESLMNACQDETVAACGGRLLDSTGRTQTGFQVRRFPTVASLSFETLGLNRLWPGNPVNRRYRCLDMDPDEPANVEQPAGAFLLIRRSAWQRLNGFDETFHPLWFEDVDFLQRAARAGYTIRYVHDSIALHAGGHSVRTLDGGARTLYWYGSLLRYTVRHTRPPGRWVVAVSVLTGSALRLITGIVVERSFRLVDVWSKVFRFSLNCLLRGEMPPVALDPAPANGLPQHEVRQALDSDRERIRRSA